jgi:hypothetical protein
MGCFIQDSAVFPHDYFPEAEGKISTIPSLMEVFSPLSFYIYIEGNVPSKIL